MSKQTRAKSDGETVDIARIVRRSNRVRVGLSALVLSVLAGWAAADAPDIANVLRGVEIVNGEEFAADAAAGRAIGRWISITGETTVPSGLVDRRSATQTGEPNDLASFSLMRIGRQVLMVRSGNQSTASSQRGIVTSVPREVADRIVDPLRSQGLDVLPVLLDTARPYRNDVLSRLASLTLFGLVAAVAFLTGLARSLNHARHPIVQNLSTHGDAQETAFVVEDELADAHVVVGPLRFTRQFLVRLTGTDLAVARLDDVVFAYARSRPWIPGLSLLIAVFRPDRASLHLYDRDGWRTRLRTRDTRSARAALEELTRRCPWAVVGTEYRPLWKRQRRRFLAAVEQRRQAPILELPPDADLPVHAPHPAPRAAQPLAVG